MTNTRFQLNRNAWHSPYEERTYRAFPETDFIEGPMRFLYDRCFELFNLRKTLVLPNDYLSNISFEKPKPRLDEEVEPTTRLAGFRTNPTSQPVEELSTTQLYLFMSEHGPVFLSTDDDYVERMKEIFHPHIDPYHREFYVSGAPKGIDEVIGKTFAGIRLIEPSTPTLRRH